MRTKAFALLCLALALVSAPVLAANAAGTWEMVVDLGGQGGNPTFVFEQDGETLSGTYRGALGEAEVTGSVKGEEIEFSFEMQGMTVTYKGKVSGESMEGSCEYGDFGSGTFTGKKKQEE